MPQEPQGCLAAILRLFGVKVDTSNRDFPYKQRDDFLSDAELSFYKVLQKAVSDKLAICPKVNLGDVFFVVRPNENKGARNKIDRKHVDFLLCDPSTMIPRCGIELDDSSHARRDRVERDKLVNKVFEVAGLPLVRVPAARSYNPSDVTAAIAQRLQTGATPPPPLVATSPTEAVPMCPKCGVPMVERVARKGQNAGQKFYGCPNYPRCKEKAQHA